MPQIIGRMKKVNIISLGCSKNLVDTELLAGQLEKAGFAVEVDGEDSRAKIVIVNTCGFIGDAKEESVNTILEQVERKKEGRVDKIFVMGCLSQRYGKELREEIPEVDAYFGKFDWQGILGQLGKRYDASCRNERRLTTPGHYAYLKIAEGCNRGCSYCAIPLMTGRYVSRPMEEIVEEARHLVGQGVKELLVLAQDITCYGVDLYHKNRLAELVGRLADIEGAEWIKLHYAYPTGFPLELLDVMRERPNVCKYLDIALQHCSDHMLRLMRRGITKRETVDLLRRIREQVPGIALRTTLMVGHPGETEEDFEELLDFVREMKFERLGVFPYSHEEDTYCDKHYRDDVPDEVKRRRAEAVMECQREVSARLSEAWIGRTTRVLVDRREGEFYVGRTEHDSPEVDPEVFVSSERELAPGSFHEVRITGADDYDLYAVAEE